MGATSLAIENGGMPRPPADTVQVTFRIPASWVREAEEIASLISRPGFRASKTDAFRAAIARGMEAIRAEAPPPPPPSRPVLKKPKR